VPERPSQPVTELLVEWSRGNEAALQELMPLVHAELRRTAAAFLRRERRGHTLEPTALVHETYLRLVDQRRTSWRNRAHFYAVAASLMRRILVDHARRRSARKRGGGVRPITLVDVASRSRDEAPELLALDEALAELEKLDARQRQVVELRFFGGLSQQEIAQSLGTSVSTVERQWRLARAWLFRRLGRASPAPLPAS
jgi:RNA polymerase sigma factor (TIGR02999 family)